jgi:polyphosphate kinase 2 (PPK2 family)
MGFCSEAEHRQFLALCPPVEKHVASTGIILIKLWLEVGQEEQERRFRARIDDPMRQWKLSPMDLESYARWYDYSRARDLTLGRQAARAVELHRAYFEDDPAPAGARPQSAAAEASCQG